MEDAMRFWTVFAVSFGFVSVALAQPPATPMEEVGMDPFERDSLIQELALSAEEERIVRMSAGVVKDLGGKPPVLRQRLANEPVDSINP